MKHVIWTDDINIEDWVDDDGKQMEYSDAVDLNWSYLDDERDILDHATDSEIICIGDIGLWDGRRKGYKLMGHNIKNILQPQMESYSFNTWYDDGKDICGTESHHDGTNYYTYRILKGNTHDEQIESAEKLFSKPLTPQRIGRFTKSIRPTVAKIYGW